MSESPREAAVRRSLSRRRSTAEDEVDRLVDVGRELFGSGANPRVADIVKAAGVTIEAFYRYFGSKDAFVVAVADDGALRVVDYVAHKMAAARSPEGRLRAAVTALMSQATDRGLALAARNILNRSTATTADSSGSATFEAALGALLSPVLVELGATERDAVLAAALLVARLQTYVWSDTSPEEADVEHLVLFLLRAVQPAT